MRIELDSPRPDELEDEDEQRWKLDRATGNYCYQGQSLHPLVMSYAGVERFHGIVYEIWYEDDVTEDE